MQEAVTIQSQEMDEMLEPLLDGSMTAEEWMEEYKGTQEEQEKIA